MSSSASRIASGLPAIDERLVTPETRHEMYDGELVYVSPADPPHGEHHLKLAALIEAHTGFAFEAAVDLLTRTSRTDDIAPDISVYLDAPDPRTGGRQLEQLAFEIVSTESLGHAAGKAAKLTGRGVRRVFAIDLDRVRVLEWSGVLGSWRELDPTGHIVDPALEVPLPIDAMINASKADDAVARALIARRNPIIEAVRAEDRVVSRAEGEIEGKIEGRIEGMIRALLAILAARGVTLDGASHARIVGERDQHRLDRWIARATLSTTTAELLSDD